MYSQKRLTSFAAPLFVGVFLAAAPGAFSVQSAQAAQNMHAEKIDIWWPVEGVLIDGYQPLKALLTDRPVETYNMHWYVDNGQWNFMHNSYEDYPHKEVTIELSGWTWRGSGPYAITFAATDFQGNILAQRTVSISVAHGHHSKEAAPVTQHDSSFPEESAAGENDAHMENEGNNSFSHVVSQEYAMKETDVHDAHHAPVHHGGNALNGERLYVNPHSPATHQANEWRHSRPDDAAHMEKIAAQPVAEWFGDWNGNVGQSVASLMSAASQQSALPVFVLYNIPQRDCGSHSAGGAGSPDGYRNWISSVADAIAHRRAIVVLEPDALTLLDCLSDHDRAVRFSLLRDAVDMLKAKGASVYIDAGHSSWISAGDIAHRLNQAGVDRADGFALNVSNFRTTEENVAYGSQVSSLTGGKHFIIDTGRNGSGPSPDNEWCNPYGRSLGRAPTTDTGHSLVDAYLWIKVPGESDGWCNGGPSAGTWWPDYALDLARRAQW